LSKPSSSKTTASAARFGGSAALCRATSTSELEMAMKIEIDPAQMEPMQTIDGRIDGMRYRGFEFLSEVEPVHIRKPGGEGG